jgi:hypothetical protein
LLLIALLSSQKDGGAGFFSPTQNALCSGQHCSGRMPISVMIGLVMLVRLKPKFSGFMCHL